MECAALVKNPDGHIPFHGRHALAARAATLLLAIAYPYLCRLGGFPNMDEGYYAYMSAIYNYNFAHGQPFAPLQGLALWPLLLAWIPDLPGNSLLWFRLADMCAALVSGWFFCSILERECGRFAYLIALVFLLCMTDSLVVNNGFRNSFFPAWACFFAAVLAVDRPGKRQKLLAWLGAGALTSLGILLRETFFPFAFLGLAVAWRSAGTRAAFAYSLAGILLAAFLAGLIELRCPGSLANFYKGYADRVLIYQEQSWRIIPHLLKYSWRSLLLFSPAVILSVAIILWWRAFGVCGWRNLDWNRIMFWLAIMLLPLYEVFVKVSFHYHFAAALPGMACLAAIFAGQPQLSLGAALAVKRWLASAILAAGALCVAGALAALPGPAGIVRTAEALGLPEGQNWPEEMMRQSTTLQTVEILDRALPKNGTVSTNGMALFILVAANRLPPLDGPIDRDDNNLLGDLGRFYLQTGKDRERVTRAILANPPDAVVLIEPKEGHEPGFTPELEGILADTGLYEKIAAVDPDSPDNPASDYDWTGYGIYRLKSLSDRKP